MKKKILALSFIIILLLPLLTITAFAADDGGLLDGIGGFLIDIVYFIVEGNNLVIEAIKSGFWSIVDALAYVVKAIGRGIADIASAIWGALTDLIKVIGEAVSYILDGIKFLFLPRPDYFEEAFTELATAIAKKFGGIISFVSYLNTKFNSLGSSGNHDDMLVIEFPREHMLSGLTMNLLAQISPYISIFRFMISGLMVVATGLYIFHRVKDMANT